MAGMYDSAISAAAAIDGKADVFQRDVYGRTPLHMGAKIGDVAIVKALLEAVSDSRRLRGRLFMNSPNRL